MRAKLRRHVDRRTVSCAIEITRHASDKPQVAAAIRALATDACSLASQMLALASNCNNAAVAVDSTTADDLQLKDRAAEFYQTVSKAIIDAGDGAVLEILEILSIMALELSTSPHELNRMSALAGAIGLDVSPLTMEDEPGVARPPTNRRRTRPDIIYSADRISLLTTAAVARSCKQVSCDFSLGYPRIIGHDGRRSFHVASLDCTGEEAKRVTDEVRAGLG